MKIIHHPLTTKDAAFMAQLRTILAGAKGTITGPDARPMFDHLMESVPEVAGLSYEQAVVGGIPGWWVRPSTAAAHKAILYLHGGAYVLGSTLAFRNLVG